MPKASPITTAFNAGELSPLLDGRVDLNKYGQGAHFLRNFVPTVQGPLERRGGFTFRDYCAGASGTASPSLLVDFVPSSSRPFMLEFAAGNLMYVWYNGGKVLSSGTPISFDYSAFMTVSALYRSDFTVAVDWAQSADVMYMTVPGGFPMKVSRLSDTSWTLTQFRPDNGPWRDPNGVKTLTIYASAQTGSVTLTSSAAVFTSDMVGMLVRIEQQDLTSIKPWEPGQKNIAVNTLRRSDGKTYKATTLGVGAQPPFPAVGAAANKWTQTGSVKPIHTEGKAWDGGVDTDFVPGATTDWYTKGVEWQFEDAGYGVARITAFTNSTTVTATVLSPFPAALVGAGGASWKWEFGAWAADAGGIFPSCVCFFRERLTFLGGTRGWCSVVGDFENFADKDFGEVLADSAVTFPLLSDQANDVQWCCASDVLYVGTTGGEFVVQTASQNEAFGPANIKVSEQTAYGSVKVRPIKVGQSTIFTQRGGRVVRELAYDFGTDSFRSNDITVLSEHVTLGGIRGAAFSRSPDPIIWYVRGDGSLLGLTYNKEQDVVAWHPHTLGAGAAASDAVKCVCTVPSVVGSYDDLYVVVRRLDGITPRFTVERLEQPYKETNSTLFMVYSDSALTYVGAPTTVITGLSHLKNRVVSVLADGAAHPNVTVDSGGHIDLNRAASTVTVGLPMVSEYEGMRTEAGAADGTAQGKTKRITRVALRFLNTLGGLFGFRGKQLDTIQFRSGSDPMDQAPPLFTGDKSLLFPDGYDSDARIYVRQEQPLPMTLVAIMPQVVTEDRG